MEALIARIKNIVPALVFAPLQPTYHALLAILGALVYRFPGKELVVIGVTGTKGKSSTLEFLNAAFEKAGCTTALASSIRRKIADSSEPNESRMTMPGRFFIQHFLRQAADAGCKVALIEITSEGARQYRHWFLYLNALVFTNLEPEHMESHGSFEAYANAKLSIGEALAHSPKRPRIMAANIDDPFGARFLSMQVDKTVPYSLEETAHNSGSKERLPSFGLEGRNIHVKIPGEFSLYNALAAAVLCRAIGMRVEHIAEGLESVERIPGRAEKISADTPFDTVVDYAHTPGSLTAIYEAYKDRVKLCVLGATGGGRDHWKRPVMGAIAEKYCSSIILTNEDPYDEDPRAIVDEIASGIKSKTPEIIMDRRQAIRYAVEKAANGAVVIITGKGTDPNIAGSQGKKEPWSDAEVAREEIAKVMSARN